MFLCGTGFQQCAFLHVRWVFFQNAEIFEHIERGYYCDMYIGPKLTVESIILGPRSWFYDGQEVDAHKVHKKTLFFLKNHVSYTFCFPLYIS